MEDNDNQNQPSLVERANSLIGMVGTTFLLNLALIAWTIYQQLWWITALAVLLGLVMAWQAWNNYRNRKGSGPGPNR
jgi:CHASE2 domain-containing sensor protein